MGGDPGRGSRCGRGGREGGGTRRAGGRRPRSGAERRRGRAGRAPTLLGRAGSVRHEAQRCHFTQRRGRLPNPERSAARPGAEPPPRHKGGAGRPRPPPARSCRPQNPRRIGGAGGRGAALPRRGRSGPGRSPGAAGDVPRPEHSGGVLAARRPPALGFLPVGYRSASSLSLEIPFRIKPSANC